GCIILANKSDLLAAAEREKAGKGAVNKPHDDKYQSIRDYISHHFPFLWMCPLIFVSALDGEGITEAVSAIKPIFDRRNKKIAEPQLKEFLNKILKTNP